MRALFQARVHGKCLVSEHVRGSLGGWWWRIAEMPPSPYRPDGAPAHITQWHTHFIIWVWHFITRETMFLTSPKILPVLEIIMFYCDEMQNRFHFKMGTYFPKKLSIAIDNKIKIQVRGRLSRLWTTWSCKHVLGMVGYLNQKFTVREQY